ncbi:MAG: hypothetical protein KDC53_00335 [Saprospiraceae bacterium]|nr:hypothetical protein [Saprospiraceae bacterium]
MTLLLPEKTTDYMYPFLSGVLSLLIFLLPFGLFAQVNVGYVEDFESFALCTASCNSPCSLSNGWINDATDAANWIVDENGTPSGATGPTVDYVPGTALGNYIYLESSNPCSANVTANMWSPELDLLGTNAPFFEFYYHMYGLTMGTLHIDISTDHGVSFIND